MPWSKPSATWPPTAPQPDPRSLPVSKPGPASGVAKGDERSDVAPRAAPPRRVACEGRRAKRCRAPKQLLRGAWHREGRRAKRCRRDERSDVAPRRAKRCRRRRAKRCRAPKRIPRGSGRPAFSRSESARRVACGDDERSDVACDERSDVACDERSDVAPPNGSPAAAGAQLSRSESARRVAHARSAGHGRRSRPTWVGGAPRSRGSDVCEGRSPKRTSLPRRRGGEGLEKPRPKGQYRQQRNPVLGKANELSPTVKSNWHVRPGSTLLYDPPRISCTPAAGAVLVHSLTLPLRS